MNLSSALILLTLLCCLGRSLQATTLQVVSIEAFLHSGGNPTPQAFNMSSPEFTSSLDANNLGSFMFTFTNNTGSIISNASWTLFFDLDIDRDQNTFFNEFGEFISFQKPIGAPSAAMAFSDWEIDEPEYVSGNIYTNSNLGVPDNTNGVPASGPANDVSQALTFRIAQLDVGQTFSAIGTISFTDTAGLAQIDPDSVVSIYINGFATLSEPTQTQVPEPATTSLAAISLAALYLRAKGR